MKYFLRHDFLTDQAFYGIINVEKLLFLLSFSLQSVSTKCFNEKVQRFININEFHVSRIFTLNPWVTLDGCVVFDEDALQQLVIPDGLHLETDFYDDGSNRKCYFLVDDESEDYEEIICRTDFWSTYTEEVRLLKTLGF